MRDDTLELTRRKILLSTGAVGLAGAGAGFGTSALFSDEEAFQNNSITAGTLNLTVTAKIVEANNYYTSSGAGPNIIGAMETADGAVETGLQAGDVKPGDWVIICFDITIEGNPAYVQISADEFAQYENGRTEPEREVDSSDGGSLGDPLNGQGEGELQDKLLAEVYDSYDSSDDSNPPRSYLSDPDNSLSGTAKESFDQFATGVVLGGSSSPTAIPAGTTVTKYLLLYLPRDVGNIVQSDALTFDLVFETEQARNNPDPFGTSGGGGGGAGPTTITSPGNSGSFGSSLGTGSPTIAGEPGYNNDEGRAWILPQGSGNVQDGVELTPANPSAPPDRVGEAVAIDGDTAVVGAPGIQQIHIYERSGGTWPSSPTTTIGKLLGPVFGIQVDIVGDLIATIGSPPGSSVPGLLLFERSNGKWERVDEFVDLEEVGAVATNGEIGVVTDTGFFDAWTIPFNSQLQQNNPNTYDPDTEPSGYGETLALTADRAFVGADGKVYVTGKSWDGFANDTPLATLTPSPSSGATGFGTESLAVTNTSAAVGVPDEGTGVVYFYEETGAGWNQTNRIIAPSGVDNFGRSLALDSSTLYVGAKDQGNGEGIIYAYSV